MLSCKVKSKQLTWLACFWELFRFVLWLRKSKRSWGTGRGKMIAGGKREVGQREREQSRRNEYGINVFARRRE